AAARRGAALDAVFLADLAAAAGRRVGRALLSVFETRRAAEPFRAAALAVRPPAVRLVVAAARFAVLAAAGADLAAGRRAGRSGGPGGSAAAASSRWMSVNFIWSPSWWYDQISATGMLLAALSRRATSTADIGTYR